MYLYTFYKFLIANQRPEMSELSRFVTEYCTLWKTVGLKLGLQNSLLNLVASEHPSRFRECFRMILQYWLDQDLNATWSTLELAITNARRDELNLDNLSESECVIMWISLLLCVHMCVRVCVCMCVYILVHCINYVQTEVSNPF